MHAILIALHQRKRKSRARVALIALLAPHSSGANNVVPHGAAANDRKSLLRWNQVAVGLHELKLKRRQMLPRRIDRRNQFEDIRKRAEISVARHVVQRQRSLEGLPRLRGTRRNRKARSIVDRLRRRFLRKQLAARQHRARYIALPGQFLPARHRAASPGIRKARERIRQCQAQDQNAKKRARR